MKTLFLRTMRLLTVAGLGLTLMGFYSGNDKNPEELGLYSANIDDRGLIELTIDQLKQTLNLLKENDIPDSSSPQTVPKIELSISNITFDEAGTASVTTTLPTSGPKFKTEIDLTFRKTNSQWQLASTMDLAQLTEQLNASSGIGPEFELYRESETTNKTLVRRLISKEHKVAVLTKSVTHDKLDRQLFGKPYAATLISSVVKLEKAPFFSSRYVLLVTDPAWNRIVYGDYDGWVKAYEKKGAGPEQLSRPHGLDRDVNGAVYVADTGNNRIVVLRLTGNGADTQLKFGFDFGSGQLNLPYDVAWDDSGTPFAPSDDLLWVADTGNDRIVAYALQENAASVRYIYGNTGKSAGRFMQPTAVAVGRFNGISSGEVYVADTGNRRIARLAVTPNRLEWLDAYQGKDESQYTSLDVDHWGNVYASERSYNEVCKFNSMLAPITRINGTDNMLVSPVNFSVTFGRIHVEAENRDYWAGYDQAMSLGKWSETSGAERFQLGVDLTDFTLGLSHELDRLSVTSTVTDHAQLALEVIDAQSNVTVRQLPVGWVVPGAKRITWDRRDGLGQPVAPSYYRLQLTAESGYGNMTIVKQTPEFYLPLYYHEDSGSDKYHDSHLVQGTRNTNLGTLPGQSVAKHPSEVIYRFANLNPTAEYEIKAEFHNEVGYLKQRMMVDDYLVDEMILPDGFNQVEWTMLPRETYSDGAIAVRITKTAGEEDAFISQLWLREANYDPASPPVLQESIVVPEQYSLSQNYPNPFNPSTTIRFGVPNNNASSVTLKIFNMLGQTIRVLVDEPLPAGSHSVVWDGRDSSNRSIATGVYFYRLRAGDFVEVRKMALTK